LARLSRGSSAGGPGHRPRFPFRAQTRKTCHRLSVAGSWARERPAFSNPLPSARIERGDCGKKPSRRPVFCQTRSRPRAGLAGVFAPRKVAFLCTGPGFPWKPSDPSEGVPRTATSTDTITGRSPEPGKKAKLACLGHLLRHFCPNRTKAVPSRGGGRTTENRPARHHKHPLLGKSSKFSNGKPQWKRKTTKTWAKKRLLAKEPTSRTVDRTLKGAPPAACPRVLRPTAREPRPSSGSNEGSFGPPLRERRRARAFATGPPAEARRPRKRPLGHRP